MAKPRLVKVRALFLIFYARYKKKMPHFEIPSLSNYLLAQGKLKT